MRRLLLRISLLAPLVLALFRCGSSDASGGGKGFAPGGGGSLSDAAGVPGVGGAGGTGGGPPPEQELEATFLAPVTTGKYVWSANPESGQVALIDAVTFEVQTLEAGFEPTHVAAVSDDRAGGANVAVVLNVSSHDATLFRVDGDGAVQSRTFETHGGANAWSIGPSGRWAVAWTDARRVENPDPTDGFQDVTVIDLDSAEGFAQRLSVGYRPTKVAFSADGERIFAVTEPGVSVLALGDAGPRVEALVEVSEDPLESPASRDVTLLPEGIAVVRRDGSADVAFVDLGTGERTAVTLGGFVTDLDVSAAGDLAIAVVRERSEVVVLPLPEAMTDASVIETVRIGDEPFGSVTLGAGADVALLYTNALPTDHVTIVELSDERRWVAHRTVTVKTPVLAVFVADDGAHAVALQQPGSSAKLGAFSVIPTAPARSPKIVGTDAPPQAVALAPGPHSDRALVTVREDLRRSFGVHVVALPSLQIDYVPLASAPLATGIVPAAGKGYVSQLHPEGRITFLDFASGEVRTLTGFELGSKVIE